uniref:BZIP domain-containing protein n=1 Tax=Ananas comosus var. bracteatus TaxID=296719 RepID=A0A6V7PIY4_ANACO|nr:unnamed protein product [Ananas comosus var. bracteatus]
MRRAVRGSVSSSSSSPPPPSSHALPQKSMEEVWEEIRPLSQLQQHNPTALTLGSGQSDSYCNGGGGTNAAVAIFTNSCFNNYTLCGPHSSSSTEHQANYCAKRRALEQQLDHGIGLDHRKKRLIKNRESAARSRARKQAYTNELEQEVAHLLDENSRLRRQYEELRLIMATQAPTKRTLHRASSAPI